MSAHPQQLWLPIDAATRAAGQQAEYEASKQVWRLSWRTRQRPPGRCLPIRNMPVQTGSGRKTFNPLQVACMAYRQGTANGFDVIHVHTPVLGSGDRGIQDLYFKVAMLKELDTNDPVFFPNVENGVITLEEESVNTMPRHYEITDAGLFVPTVR